MPRLSSLFSALLLFTSLACVATVRAVEVPSVKTAEISFKGGTFADTTFEDVPYVSTELLGELFSTTPRWEPSVQQLRLRDPKGREWVLTLDNPFVSVAAAASGGKAGVYNLTYPVRRGPERIYVPWHPIVRLLRDRFGIDLPSGRSADRTRSPAAVPVPVPAPVPTASGAARKSPGLIHDLILEETADGSVLRIQASPGAQWRGIL